MLLCNSPQHSTGGWPVLLQGSVDYRPRPEDVEDLIKTHFANSAMELLDEDDRMPGFDPDKICALYLLRSPCF